MFLFAVYFIIIKAHHKFKQMYLKNTMLGNAEFTQRQETLINTTLKH